MKVTRQAYKTARMLRDLEVFLSLDPKRILRRQLNKRILRRATPFITWRKAWSGKNW